MTAQKKQQGVALILVLMITGILGLLMLQIGLTARDHVARAQLLLDRAEASLRLQSRESAMLFSLMTQEWSEGKADPSSANPYAAKWNFRGEPFETDGARFRIQDVKGLFPMPQPGESTKGFERFLIALGIERDRAERVGRQLSAYEEFDRDVPESRRIPLQAFGELRGVVDLSKQELDRLADAASLFPSGDINPATASDALLAARYDGLVLDGIRQLRSSNSLDALSFARINENGLDEMTALFPGPAIRLDTTVKAGEVRYRRETTIIVRPHEPEPIIFWGRRHLDAAGALL